MNKLINLLERRGLVWHGNSQQQSRKTIPSGYSELDSALDGGFPEHSVIEFESDNGIGELRLILNSFKLGREQALNNEPHTRLFVVIALPGIINAEMLDSLAIPLEQVVQIAPQNHQQALWAAEQCLKSGACDTVALWHQQSLTVAEVKRLQQACEQGQATQFLVKQNSANEIKISLPVALKLKLKSHPRGVDAEIKKQKGGWPGKHFHINMTEHWPMLCVPESRHKPASNLLLFPRIQQA